MKIPTYLTNSLAIVGVISFVIMACSADDASNSTISNETGRYQITTGSHAASRTFHVIDTQTGVVKSFGEDGAQPGTYVLQTTTITQ